MTTRDSFSIRSLGTAVAVVGGCIAAGWLADAYLESMPRPMNTQLIDRHNSRWFPCDDCGEFVPVVDLEPIPVAESSRGQPDMPEVSISCYVTVCSRCRSKPASTT